MAGTVADITETFDIACADTCLSELILAGRILCLVADGTEAFPVAQAGSIIMFFNGANMFGKVTEA